MTTTTLHPLDLIREVCKAENRNPAPDEIFTDEVTTTRVLAVDRSPFSSRLSVTFTCHNRIDPDAVRSIGLVRDRGAVA